MVVVGWLRVILVFSLSLKLNNYLGYIFVFLTNISRDTNPHPHEVQDQP